MSESAWPDGSVATTELDTDSSEATTAREEEPGSDGASGADGGADGGADLFDLWNRPLPMEPVAPMMAPMVTPTCSTCSASGAGGGAGLFDLSDGASGADGGANLGELWVAACVEARGLPVVFQYVSDQALENAIYDIAPVADAFYIGATTDPRRRWIGGDSMRGYMQGHSKVWDKLHVFHLSHSESSRCQETRLIEHCLGQYPGRCTNLAVDARGQVKGMPNFLYVALRY